MMEIKKRKLTELLLKNNILKYGDFTLKSGKKSWFYIDLRLISSYPETFEFVIDCYIDIIKSIPNVDALAGVAVAGIPFSAVTGYKLGIPSIIVRPQAKEHGLKKIVEGSIPSASKIVLIDDLITTGSSKIPGISALRDNDFVVDNLIVLIDRSQSSLEELEDLNVKLHSFITINEIFKLCLELDEEYISKQEKKLIEKNM
ncbi:MAG: orotate phosphoribosyltransferase [Candidatus Heimdallarchaeota archaeon]|jgi:orotate phosphoribosyltransferase|nr:orotate phosphoribosyltransferase [Candidatus Heimdallarchaeota archaeon]MCK4253781.1 orotate phosphoribosyltransferase [Candidatus Heimdallarchaeota archaeon]